LQNNNPTVVAQIRLPSAGTFALFGRVILANLTESMEGFTTTMTTLDGTTILDTVQFSIPNVALGNSAHVSLMSTINMALPANNEIVDIRCSAVSGVANSSLLYAISVDEIVTAGM
jgi:hypothetical protein